MSLYTNEMVSTLAAKDVKLLPSVATLKAAMADIMPVLRANAAATERARRVPAANFELLQEAGLLRLVQPQIFGGYGYDFDVLVDLAIDAASACPSTGWVYSIFTAHRWLVSGFGAEAQHDLWDKDPDTVICGSYAPSGKIVPVGNGYELSGRWSFASGCDLADWALCSTILPSAAEGQPPAPAFVLIPRASFSIDDTWNTSGLAGTGSKTLVLQDAFVPRHRILTFREAVSGQTPGRRLHGDPGFGTPLFCNLPSIIAAVAVGAATGALESFIDATGQRLTRGAVAGGSNRMAEFPTIQIRVTEASASIDAAREILIRDLRNRAHEMRTVGSVSTENRLTSRRGQAFATSLSIKAAEALNASTGGNGLDVDNPVQRAWRDANAVGRHISLNWDAVGTMYGQMALGLEPKGQF